MAPPQIGIDLDGAISMFSDAIMPTFVVHLAAAPTFATFIAGLRDRGLKTTSVIVDGAEVFRAELDHRHSLSWAVAGDWLWLHLSPTADDTTAWFTAAHPADATAKWATDWSWATGNAAPGSTTALVHLRELVDLLAVHAPELAACTQLLRPVARVGVSVAGDGHHTGGSIAFDLGPASAVLAAHVLPIPDGWNAAPHDAPFAVQWNLDLAAMHDALGPCARVLGLEHELDNLASIGVRSGRAALLGFSPDGPTVSAVVSADLASRKGIDGLLDQIPMRRFVDHDATFAGVAGHRLAVPTLPEVDYILSDQRALGAAGDGLLAKVIGKGGTEPAPLASLDISPAALPREAWQALFGYLEFHSPLLVDAITAWHGGHLDLHIDHDRLVFEAHGDRR